jgi:uncharacterized membrane protein YdjX (TVP38/TMEM64 family)
MKTHKKKIALLGAIVLLNIFLWFYFDVGSLLTFDTIKNNRSFLLQMVENHYTFSVATYIAIYAIDAALFLPATAIMIILGGFLFGVIPTLVYGIMGATLGATTAFLTTRYLFGKSMQTRYHEKLQSFNDKLEQNSIRYLLFVRIVPIFPFFLINILAGLTLIPLSTFVWTTAVGIIPNLIIYACIGRELTTLNSFRDIFTVNLFLAMLVLTLLSIVPLVINHRNKSLKKSE